MTPASTSSIKPDDAVEASCHAARAASRSLALLATSLKNTLLTDLADALESPAGIREVLDSNARDLAAAEKAGLAVPKLARLRLTEASIRQLAASLRQVAALPDPVGEVTRDRHAESGLHVRKVRAPLGVVCMIYEARPGVTIDAFALCFKSGNACILKGGKEAAESNNALAAIVRAILERHAIPAAAITSISTIDRADLERLLTMDRHIDLVIPRGGPDLIRFVVDHATIPTVQHFQGICHIYVDADADQEMAEQVCATAKTSAPATCNACECVLVHRDIADSFIPRLVQRFRHDGVEVRGTPLVRALAPEAVAAQPDDFGREFLDLIVAIRIVDSLDAAIDHIRTYGSSHTEAIITRDTAAAERFTREVDAACVLVNASTRMNDGFSLGLGAEIGISTSRVHAYGPMGLEELTTQRWIVEGTGQTR